MQATESIEHTENKFREMLFDLSLRGEAEAIQCHAYRCMDYHGLRPRNDSKIDWDLRNTMFTELSVCGRRS